MSDTVRWVLVEESTSDTWTMPMNPITMDAFPRERTLQTAYPSRNTQDRHRTFQTGKPLRPYTWGGSIRTKDHYDALRLWARKPGVIHVTDHLGREFRIIMQTFKPERKAGRRPGNYRMKYTVTAQWIERTT